MQMTMRWFGAGYDSVALQNIRQIPGVKGIITTLYGKQPGEVWREEEFSSLSDFLCK
jgi:mannonate dehydratase